MNTNYLEEVAQSIVALTFNRVVSNPEENESYTFDDISSRTLGEMGFDELDIMEMTLIIEQVACVMFDDEFFENKNNQFGRKSSNDDGLDFNYKITFQEIADYLAQLMYSALNS